MPIYEFDCSNDECCNEWEDICSMNGPLPTTCPACGQETAKRVMSLQMRGQVELTGQELKASIKSAGKKLGRDASRNENLYANLLNPDKYQALTVSNDKAKRERGKK
jgi:putative FmdB family regulatory protein